MSDEDQFKVDQIVPKTGVSDDEVLDLVRGTRLSILEAQVKNGVPVDKDSWAMLHQNLQELDRSAVTKKRLAQDEKTGESSIALAQSIADAMIRNMGKGGRDLYAVTEYDENAVLPDPLKDIEGTATIAPGELHVGDDTGNYEEFQATVGKRLEEERRNISLE